MPRSRRLGSEAEDRAASYLQSIGYTIVTRNYVVAGYSEIDVICMDGDTIVFVEVKARRSCSMVGPEESVSKDKARRLWLAAQCYLSECVGKEVSARFDIVALDGLHLRHHIDAIRV